MYTIYYLIIEKELNKADIGGVQQIPCSINIVNILDGKFNVFTFKEKKYVKGRMTIYLIVVLLFIDQGVKFYIKTHYYYGEEVKIFGLDWFRLHFIENPGMAWGWKLGEGDAAKITLTLLRLVAVVWGSFYIKKIIRRRYHAGFIICVALIYSGALGNLIDGLFYGLIFEKSDPGLQNVAAIFPSGGGYGGLMNGSVVDMLYFPIIHAELPQWIPFWGGKDFEFFSPVFNIADVWISAGVLAFLIFQKRFFKKTQEKELSDDLTLSATGPKKHSEVQ